MKTLNHHFDLQAFLVARGTNVSSFNSFKKIALVFGLLILMSSTSFSATTYTSNSDEGWFHLASSWTITGSGNPKYYVIQEGDTMIIVSEQVDTNIQVIDVKGLLGGSSNLTISPQGKVSVWPTGQFVYKAGSIKIAQSGSYEITSSWNGITSGGADWEDPDQSWQPTGPLPVSLMDFSAVKAGTGVLLNWKIASEEENDFFTIERSNDGLEYTPIGFVQGAGNSTTITNYSYRDDAPESGINYYRLKQTDFNKETAYLQIEIVDFKLNTDVEIKVYPNPTSNILHVKGVDTRRGIFEIQIINSTGSLIKEVNSTDNSDNLEISIDVSGLAPGLYFLVTSDPHKSRQNQFVVTH